MDYENRAGAELVAVHQLDQVSLQAWHFRGNGSTELAMIVGDACFVYSDEEAQMLFDGLNEYLAADVFLPTEAGIVYGEPVELVMSGPTDFVIMSHVGGGRASFHQGQNAPLCMTKDLAAELMMFIDLGWIDGHLVN